MPVGFAYGESWAALFGAGLPFSAEFGVLLAPDLDPTGLRFSIQIGKRNTEQSVWDSPSNEQGWDQAAWDDGDFAIWVDVSDRFISAAWDAGAADPASEPEVAKATVTLSNLDGEVSPWATTGPFTNPTDESPVWDVTAWDEVTPRSGSSLIRPGTPLRFGVTTDPDGGPISTYLAWFTGLIDTVDEGTDENAHAWVTLGLVDVASQLAGIGAGKGTDGSKLTVDEDTGLSSRTPPLLVNGSTGEQMVEGILTDCAFPYVYAGFTHDADTDPTPMFTSAPQVAPEITANRLQAAQSACEAGDAFLLATTRGTLVAVDRSVRFVTGDVWSNNPSDGQLPVGVDAMTPYSARDRLLNSATGTRSGDGALPQTASDAESIFLLGESSESLGWPKTSIPLENDSDVLALAARAVTRQANDFQGISAIDVDADMSPLLWERLAFYAATGLESGLIFTADWTHPSGNVLIVDVYLIGFSFSLAMEGTQAKWTGTLRTAKA